MRKLYFSRRDLLRAAALGALLALPACGRPSSPAAAQSGNSSGQDTASPTTAPTAGPTPPRALFSGQYRAMWISYLEWGGVDFSSKASFTAAVAEMLDNCVSLGLNTVIAQVRPFGDALYASDLYPWSHLCTGTQGKDPGYDPLDILVAECHSRGLSLEAWLNPYRLRLNERLPAKLADTNLANTAPEWVVEVNGGLYLNPAIPAAAEYVVEGVREIVNHYAVDGIHFDDYFYPTTDTTIDEAQFQFDRPADRDGWRRANVTALVQAAYDAVKSADPTLRFGISPQGNPDNNYSQQYSDVADWITRPCVDYICPQIYWGYHFTLKSGSTRFAFENILPEWLAMPRNESVALVIGLGAWRIGDGDSGRNEDSVALWSTGHALADQIEDLTAQGADGYALYRYGSLFNSAYPELAAAECEAIRAGQVD